MKWYTAVLCILMLFLASHTGPLAVNNMATSLMFTHDVRMVVATEAPSRNLSGVESRKGDGCTPDPCSSDPLDGTTLNANTP